MTKITYSPYLKKKYSTDNFGVIQVRRTENRKSTYYTLSESLKEIYWNKKKGEVRSNYKECERLTNLIKDKIDELKFTDNKEPENLVEKIEKESNEKVSFIKFFENQLLYYQTRREIGSYKSHKTSYFHLMNFLKTLDKKDLLFSELTTFFIRDFETYLKCTKDLSTNTCIKYLKTTKNVFKKGIEFYVYTTNIDPFLRVNKKKTPVSKDPLTKVEIETIFNTKIDKNDPLYNVKNYFLFQIFSQGTRVSDLISLRWGNLVSGNLVFYQFKTKKPHLVSLNEIILLRLVDYLPNGDKILNTKFNFSIDNVDYNMTYQEIEKHYELISKENISNYINISDIMKGINKVDKNIEKLLQTWLDLKNEKKNLIKMKLEMEITEYSLKNPSKFIFPILDNKIFENVQFDSQKHTLSKYQYNQMSSKTTIYNKQLKKLQERCGLNKVLTTHLSRHSYTGLMIEHTGKDIYTISKNLGHSGLGSTEHYVSDFLDNRVISENDGMTKTFNNIF
jgi:site-specific recombinase XerD